MNILLDQGTPVHLRHWLTAHWVSTTYEQGWSSATNQDLFLWAGQLGYRLLVSTDINLRYQQNLQPHTLAILVLSTEPETILTLADRVTVIRKGTVAREFSTGHIEKADLLAAA